MPFLKCKNCGRTTSTTVSDFMDSWPDAAECYLATDPKTKIWVKGCGYKKASKTDKALADRWLGKTAAIAHSLDQTISRMTKEEDDVGTV
jgi:hypothetical protein